MIDSNSSGQEQDRMKSGSGAVVPFLRHREWSEEELQELARNILTVKTSDYRFFGFEEDTTFQFGHAEFLGDKNLYLYTEVKAYLYVDGNCVTGDPDKTGGVLANLKQGGKSAVDAYLTSLETDDNQITEKSQCLPASDSSSVVLKISLEEWENLSV